jgi:AcrR family transcriptional regulator
MKTAERILVTSLELFNSQGENNVSSVDIAIELDISPGNLYYHYKGKEVIVSALFGMYQQQSLTILHALEKDTTQLEEFFCLLYLLLEHIYLFRFLFHNPADLSLKYPLVAKGYKQSLIVQEKTFNKALTYLIQNEQLKCTAEQQQQLAELITLLLTQSHNYQWIKGKDLDKTTFIYHNLSRVLFCMEHYVVSLNDDLIQLKLAIQQHRLQQLTELTQPGE